MTANAMPRKISELFRERGAEEYHGEAVSQLEHGLQAAMLAERENASDAEITAALLHDVGHLLHAHGENAAEQGIDDRHEALGQRFLEKYFGPDVSEPVRLHVDAKRYLTAVEPGYLARLSDASIRSLELQGGSMSEQEVRDFESQPYCRSAVRLRRWDDNAKIPDLPTPPLEHYLAIAARLIRE